MSNFTTVRAPAYSCRLRREDLHQLYINGEFVAPQSSATLDVIDPSTTDVIARVPDASPADVDRAVSAARRAFDEGPWKEATAQDRGRILLKLAEIVRGRADELAELETRNTGKPIVEAEFDIADVATCFEYYGGLATKIHGDVMPVPDNAMSLALREPIGVAGQIVPWNYPLLMAAWKLAPAICAGCTTVLKPAEQTPLTVLELASSFADAGLPPGVVNIVTGVGETAGAAIVEHPDVDKIAFTGSAEVGKTIMRSAADTLKKISLELGGKSPNIFFADADFEIAVEGALFGVFFNQGEVCSAGSRILVQRSIYKRFLDAMVEKARTIKLGPGMDRDTKMGRSSAASNSTASAAYQEIGKGEAKTAMGGGRASGGALDRGYFIEPTIFYDVDNRSRIAREEIFGPGGLRDSVRRRAGGAADRQRHVLRARRGRVDARHLPRHARRQDPCARASSGSITCSRPTSRRRGAATSRAASAASWASGASRNI